jgi:hypothetical protein
MGGNGGRVYMVVVVEIDVDELAHVFQTAKSNHVM